jgi:hypothetical protein
MMFRRVLFLTITCPPGRPPNDPPGSPDLFGVTDATSNTGRADCAASRAGACAAIRSALGMASMAASAATAIVTPIL